MPTSWFRRDPERARARAQTGGEAIGRTPWHLWIIGGAALIWYALGALTIQFAQLGRLPHLSPDEIAYYAAKPAWLVALTALSTYGSVIAALLLLLRRRAAVPLFMIALGCILLSDAAELIDGSARAYANQGAAMATVLIAIVALAMLLYARAMRRRGVLR